MAFYLLHNYMDFIDMKEGAVLINCLLKNKNTEKHFKKIINEFKIEILKDTYIDYPDFKSTYHLCVFRKK